MRTRYHKWNDTSLAMLRSYREQDLSWEIIAGKISAAYDTLLTAESCRKAYTRYGATDKTTPKRKGDTPGLSLPLALTDPPASVLEQIENKKERLGYSRLYYVPHKPTTNQINNAITQHWNHYVDYVARLNELTQDDIKAASAHGPTKWFKRWIIGISMWNHQDDSK